jgi:hypothetical protein
VHSVVGAKKAAAKMLLKASRRASVGSTVPSATGGAAGGAGGASGKWRRSSKVFRRASLLYQNAANIAKLLVTPAPPHPPAGSSWG